MKKKRKDKEKRQISIITVFLWLFMIATMITVVANRIKNQNSVDNLDNWTLQTVFLDSTVNNGEIPVTSIDWSATSYDESRTIKMQINYKNNNVVTRYEPGELKISINQLHAYDGMHTIDAISAGTLEQGYDWNYSVKDGIITFTNNIAIEEKTNIDGSLQITYLVSSELETNGYEESFSAVLKNQENTLATSSEISFKFSSNKKVHTVSKIAEKLKGYDGMIEGAENYIWVKWQLSCASDSTNVRRVTFPWTNGWPKRTTNNNSPTTYFIEHVPADAVVLDDTMQIMENNNGEVKIYPDLCYAEIPYYTLTQTIFVGYPRDQYAGTTITNTLDAYGIYWDETEESHLGTCTKEIDLGAYEIPTGEGGYYNIYKYCVWSNRPNVYTLQHGKTNSMEYRINPLIRYPGYNVDVITGDDVVMAPDTEGNYRQLTEEEYTFSWLKINGTNIRNINGVAIQDHEVEVYLRYKGSSEYIQYQDANGNAIFHANKDTSITLPSDVVGWKVIFKDMRESIQANTNGIPVIQTTINLKTPNISEGYLVNSTYIETRKKEVLDSPANETTYNYMTVNSDIRRQDLFSVSEFNTIKNILKNYDQTNYTMYRYRALSADKIVYNEIWTVLGITAYQPGTLKNNPTSEEFTGSYLISNNINTFAGSTDSFRGQCYITLLPQGMEYKNAYALNFPSALKNGITKTKSGIGITEEYVKEHYRIEVKENWNGTGRTLVKQYYDFSDDPINLNTLPETSFYFYATLDISVSYDSYEEFGDKWPVTVWLEFLDGENADYQWCFLGAKIETVGSVDTLDLNENGKNERLYTNTGTATIIDAVASHQDVQIQVQTDKSNYSNGSVETSCDTEYIYKLRVRTGSSDVTNLIIYNNIEEAYGDNEHWKGEFLGIDTSYAESKGYTVKTYYSEKMDAGTLSEDKSWQEYTDEVDKTKVKSLAFKYLDVDGNSAILPENTLTYVLVKMKSPNDNKIITMAYNDCFTEWNAIDELGNTIDFITGINSNIVNVEIHKDDVRTSISGKKTWKDEENKYDARPESITVKLMQDGQEYATTTTDASKNWEYTFENVPVYKSNTSVYQYEVKEDTVVGYKTTYEGYNITNEIELTELTATKIWEDNNNESGKRPSSVILQVKDGDKLISEHEASESDGWKYTFTGLQKYRTDGAEIEYTVDEKSFANDKFYTKEIVGNVITNRFTVPDEKIKITGIKAWNDNNNEAGKRPSSITLQVKNGDTVVSEAEVNSGNNWSYEFELAKYDNLGNEITYTIDEKDTGSKFYVKEKIEGNTVTNKFEVPDEKVKLEVEKVWDDNENEAGKRPSSVILQVKDGERVVKEQEVTETDSWKYTFELPKYDSLGNEIKYTVDEEYVSEFYTKEIVGNIVTNKFEVPEDKIKVVGTKVWDDQEDFAKKRPESVTLQVIADGEVITEHEVSDKNNWTYEFELPKYDKYGNEIKYHIDERDIGSKFYEKELTDSTTVTNKFVVPDEKVKLEVIKTWEDEENKAGKRPESIVLIVKNNGVEVAREIITEKENWKYTFELPKYNETGDEIEYTVDEEFTSKFYVKEVVGNVITNKFVVPEDKIKLVGTKVWEDNGNAGGKRESSVTLQVKAGEKVIAEAEVSDKNNWSYEFELAKYDELGEEIKYHIDERETGNKFYEKELTNETTVTNKFVVPEEVVLVKAVKKWEDKNDEYGKRPSSVTLQVRIGDKIVAEEKVNEKNNWSYEFKLPKYDELGDEIKYTVDEKETPKYYEKRLEGETVINTCTYESPVNTGDINIFTYIVIFLVAIVGVIVGIFVVKNNKKLKKQK